MLEYEPDFARYQALIEGDYAPQFTLFQELLCAYNQKFNLTSVTEKKEILIKHFLDSLAGEALFPEGARAAEVGSGAGFPSLPVKILRKDLNFTLFEANEKKCGFLRILSEQLALSVQVKHLRAEDAALNAAFREKFDVCCARAVARLNTLCEYCLPLVKVGGFFLAYKSDCPDEILQAERAVRILGGEIECVRAFCLPEGYGKRLLITIRKRKPTPGKYPRGRGKERSEPIL